MSVLQEFSPEEHEQIIRLPFRVGMWISQSDTTGGSESASAERDVLNTIVAAYAEDYLKSEFVQRLMEETLAKRDEWDKWSDNIAELPAECGRLLGLLATRVPSSDVNNFKNNLMDIAIAVAMAFRETSTIAETPFDRIRSFFRILFGGFRTATADESISAAEHRALVELANVMGINSAFINSAA